MVETCHPASIDSRQHKGPIIAEDICNTGILHWTCWACDGTVAPPMNWKERVRIEVLHETPQ